MARPEEFMFTAHCCGGEEITLECKVCPIGVPSVIRIPNGNASEIFEKIADHVHRDPSSKPCGRTVHRRALEV